MKLIGIARQAWGAFWGWLKVHADVITLVVFVLGVGGTNLFWTAHAIQADDRKWCATLNLLTSRPVPRPTNPRANPSRQLNYEFYISLVELRHRQGCD